MKMALLSLRLTAALRPTAVRCGFPFPPTPPLSLSARLCASGTDGANSYRASGALPQQPKSGVAGGPGALPQHPNSGVAGGPGALPQQPKSGVAGGPGALPSNPKAGLQGAPALGSSRGRTLVATGCIFERGH